MLRLSAGRYTDDQHDNSDSKIWTNLGFDRFAHTQSTFCDRLQTNVTRSLYSCKKSTLDNGV